VPPLVAQGPTAAGAPRPAVRVGLPLRRGRARDRGGRRPRPARGDHGDHGPVPGRVRRQPAGGRARGAGPRRRRLARGSRPRRPGERHARPAAALRAGAEPGRAGLAVPARALPLAARLPRLPGHRRRLLHRLEPARSSPTRAAYAPSATSPGSGTSVHRLGGIIRCEQETRSISSTGADDCKQLQLSFDRTKCQPTDDPLLG
jgi:hypothetical protein